jgi:hypothetical protein
MTLMENFRDFQVGPDPFGRTWHAMFKYLQTAISIRHSDSIDVCFVLESGGERMKKTVVIHHADVRAFAARTGRVVSDTWCSRIAVCRLRHVIETAEDLEKDYLTVTPQEIAEYDAAIGKWEQEWVKTHHAA